MLSPAPVSQSVRLLQGSIPCVDFFSNRVAAVGVEVFHKPVESVNGFLAGDDLHEGFVLQVLEVAHVQGHAFGGCANEHHVLRQIVFLVVVQHAVSAFRTVDALPAPQGEAFLGAGFKRLKLLKDGVAFTGDLREIAGLARRFQIEESFQVLVRLGGVTGDSFQMDSESRGA